MQASRGMMLAWLGQSVEHRLPEGSNEAAIKTCPICGDGEDGNKRRQWRHSLNVELGLYHCYRNDCACDFFELVRIVEGLGQRSEAIAYLLKYGRFKVTELVSDPDTLRERLVGLLERAPQVPMDTITKLEQGIPYGFINDVSLPEMAPIVGYALKRNLPPDFILSGNLGTFTDGELAGRMVMLVVENGKTVFWMGRSIDNRLPKYLYPSERSVGRGKNDVLFGIDTVIRNCPVFLCEGAISALSCGGPAVATLGITISRTQALKLATRRPSVVYMVCEPNVSVGRWLSNVDVLEGAGLSVHVIHWAGGSDPNDNPHDMDKNRRCAQVIDLETKIGAMLR